MQYMTTELSQIELLTNMLITSSTKQDEKE